MLRGKFRLAEFILTSVAVTVVDIAITGQLENHHVADILLSAGLYALSITCAPAALVAGTVLFVADMTCQAYTHQSLTEKFLDH